MSSFPHYHQHDAMDCGPTCLRMIAAHYGHVYSLEGLRERAHITREGVSMLGISEAAEVVGFRTLGVRLSFEKLLEAPLPCIVHWNQNHFVVVYTIAKRRTGLLRKTTSDYTVKVADPAAGKIKLNQLVNIKIDGYPYMEYGTLQGRVKSVSLIPDENSYAIDVELPQSLETITGNRLPFGGELAGQAEIITDGRSLFARIFSPLGYLLKNQMRIEN